MSKPWLAHPQPTMGWEVVRICHSQKLHHTSLQRQLVNAFTTMIYYGKKLDPHYLYSIEYTQIQ